MSLNPGYPIIGIPQFQWILIFHHFPTPGLGAGYTPFSDTSHWIGLRENFNRKPMGFYHQIVGAFLQTFPSSNSMISGWWLTNSIYQHNPIYRKPSSNSINRSSEVSGLCNTPATAKIDRPTNRSCQTQRICVEGTAEGTIGGLGLNGMV